MIEAHPCLPKHYCIPYPILIVSLPPPFLFPIIIPHNGWEINEDMDRALGHSLPAARSMISRFHSGTFAPHLWLCFWIEMRGAVGKAERTMALSNREEGLAERGKDCREGRKLARRRRLEQSSSGSLK